LVLGGQVKEDHPHIPVKEGTDICTNNGFRRKKGGERKWGEENEKKMIQFAPKMSEDPKKKPRTSFEIKIDGSPLDERP